MSKHKLLSLVLRVIAVGAFIIGGALLLSSCNKSSDSTSSVSYVGAGSQWTATFTGSNFVITQAPSVGAAVALTVNGTFQSYTTGFMVLTVTSSTGTGGPSAGDKAYALEVPGSVLFLMPIGANSNLIPMVTSGSCPTTTLSENWVYVKVKSGWTYNTDESDGTFTFNSSTGAADLPASYTLTAPTATLGDHAPGSGTCSNGLLQISGNGGADLFLTSGGGAIVHINTSTEGTTNMDQIVFALPAPASAVTLTDLAGDYGGLVFSPGSASSKVFPVSLTLAAGGGGVTGTAHELSDVTTGTQGSGAANVVLNTVGVSNGFVTGTIDVGQTGTTQPLTCIVQENAGGTSQKILSCDGVDQSHSFFNVLLVSH